MRIHENGNVGIGITSPQYRLHIEGVDTRVMNRGADASSYATFNAQSSDEDNLELVAYGRSVGGTYLGQVRAGGLFVGATPYIGERTAVMGIGTRNNAPLVLGTNDAERVRVTADGKCTGKRTTSANFEKRHIRI